MTSEERKKVISKGRGWLMCYLNEEADNCLTSVNKDTRRHLMRVIGDRYRALMDEDEKFFGDVSSFVSKRRSSEEKRRVMHEVACIVVSNGVRAEFARRYPCEYSLP